MKQVMKVIIDRTKWLRGEGSDNSYLLRSTDNKMCCLGFCSIAYGFTELEISNFRTTYSICQLNKNITTPNWFKAYGNWTGPKIPANDITRMMITNDNSEICEQQREHELTELFAKHDIQIEFIN